MLPSVHKAILSAALAGRFSPRAYGVVFRANLMQDAPLNLIGHDPFHYDNDVYKGDVYLGEQRDRVVAGMSLPNVDVSWKAFGRLTHAAQDFYAHTNYVSLWLERFPESPPSDIDPLRKDILDSPGLHAAKIYFPYDMFYSIRPLRKFALSLAPRDSHACMNLDSKDSGPRFDHAFTAAVKRTRYEFDLLKTILAPDRFARFTDL